MGGFYTVTESGSWEEGAKSCLTLAGLGKLAPNFVLIGFKSDWMSNLADLQQYFNVLHTAYDHNLSIGILRVRGGLDFSAHINAEETVAEVDEERRGSLDVAEDKKNGGVANRASGGDGKGEQLDNSENSADSNELSPPKVEVLPLHRMRTRTISRAVYETHDGAPLDKTIVDNIKQFQVGKKKGFIDVCVDVRRRWTHPPHTLHSFNKTDVQ